MEFSTENRKVYLLHQKNQDSSEDLHKVNKEVKGMSDEVFVASSPLLNDHLGVPHDESAEKQESSPQVDLENQLGLEKEVQKPEPEQSRKAAQQSAAQVEVLAVRSKQRGSRETSKDHT